MLTDTDTETVTDREHAVLCFLLTGRTSLARIRTATTLHREKIVRCFHQLEERGMILTFPSNGTRTAVLTQAGLDYLDRGHTTTILNEYTPQP